MKHMAVWLTIAALVVSLVGCAGQAPATADEPLENPYLGYSYRNAVDANQTASTPSFEALDDLTTDIVKGYLLDDRKQDMQYIGDTEFVAYGCTISTLVITEVYKGALKAGDEVPFAEPYYVDEKA